MLKKFMRDKNRFFKLLIVLAGSLLWLCHFIVLQAVLVLLLQAALVASKAVDQTQLQQQSRQIPYV